MTTKLRTANPVKTNARIDFVKKIIAANLSFFTNHFSEFDLRDVLPLGQITELKLTIQRKDHSTPGFEDGFLESVGLIISGEPFNLSAEDISRPSTIEKSGPRFHRFSWSLWK